MGKGGTTITINGEKLHRTLIEKGLALPNLSLEMGFNADYLRRCCKRNTISTYGMKSLTHLTGITEDDVKPEEPKPEVTAEEPAPQVVDNGLSEFLAQHKVIFDIDYERLNGAVFAAVYGAIKKAYFEGYLGGN